MKRIALYVAAAAFGMMASTASADDHKTVRIGVEGAYPPFSETTPDGEVGHAILAIGDAVFMLSDAFPDMGAPAPTQVGGTAVSIMLYVDDCDAATERAVAAGAALEMEPTDQFWGNRDSRIVDPYGHRWNLAQRVEDVGAEELARRVAAFDPDAH